MICEKAKQLHKKRSFLAIPTTCVGPTWSADLTTDSEAETLQLQAWPHINFASKKADWHNHTADIVVLVAIAIHGKHRNN